MNPATIPPIAPRLSPEVGPIAVDVAFDLVLIAAELTVLAVGLDDFVHVR